MKNTLAVIFCITVILLAFGQCKKSPGDGPAQVCTTCVQQCVNGTIHINGVGIAGSGAYCGDSAGVQHWEDSMNTVYSNANGYTMVYNNSATISHKYCGTQAQIDDTIAHFASQGYNCN